MNLRKAYVIAKKDFGTYFNSPIAYIVVVAYLVISGFLFFNALFDPRGGQEASMRPFFGLAPFFFAIFAPAVTMRLLAEEKHTGTIQLLATLPVRNVEVVVGKFFAGIGLVAVAIALTIPWAITVSMVGDPDGGAIIGGYLGLLLMCSAYVALGLMASSWTRNQIVAFIIGFLLCFVFFMVGKVMPYVADPLVPLLEYLSFDHHFRNIARGVIDSRNIIYYLSVVVVALAFAGQSLERRKWARS
jgi:ABC-2 type transport system permease protein